MISNVLEIQRHFLAADSTEPSTRFGSYLVTYLTTLRNTLQFWMDHSCLQTQDGFEMLTFQTCFLLLPQGALPLRLTPARLPHQSFLHRFQLDQRSPCISDFCYFYLTKIKTFWSLKIENCIKILMYIHRYIIHLYKLFSNITTTPAKNSC